MTDHPKVNWKTIIFEDEPAKPPTPAPTPPPQRPANEFPAGFPIHEVPSAPVPIVTDGSVYRKLLANTDFEVTVVGGALAKYLRPLANVPIDDATKLKAALAQAQANENINAQEIAATFSDLHGRLDREDKNFFAWVETQKSNLEEKKRQIEQLNAQLLALTTDAGAAQSKIDNATAEFQAALSKRKNELDAQALHYQSLLQ